MADSPGENNQNKASASDKAGAGRDEVERAALRDSLGHFSSEISWGEMLGLIFSKSWILAKQYYRPVFYIAFVQTLFIRLAMYFFPIPAENIQASSDAALLDHMSPGLLLNLFLFAVLVLWVGTVGNALIQIFFVASGQSGFEKNIGREKNNPAPISFLELWGYLKNKLIFILLGCLFYYFLMSIGMALYFLPAVLLGSAFFLYLPIILFENKTPLAALKRSWELTKLKYGVMVCLFIATSLLYLMPQLAIEALADQGLISVGLSNVLMIFAASLILPLCNAITLVTYSYQRLFLQMRSDPKILKDF